MLSKRMLLENNGAWGASGPSSYDTEREPILTQPV